MATDLPRIAVLGTGGTISSLGASSLDVLDYPDFGQKLTCEALLDRFPETRLVADPVPVTFRQVGSTDIGPKDWIEIRSLIHRITRDEPAVAGFVIAHGTATLEETAFFLNLTLATAHPVVLVGAQRPASALGTDAMVGTHRPVAPWLSLGANSGDPGGQRRAAPNDEQCVSWRADPCWCRGRSASRRLMAARWIRTGLTTRNTRNVQKQAAVPYPGSVWPATQASTWVQVRSSQGLN